jgi:hypothetical protein
MDWAAMLLVGAVAIGLVLRVVQYSAATSLWLDELAFANNLVTRGVRNLVSRPLDFVQVVPAGFLLVEKLAALVMGPSELSLRLWPFLMGCAALPLSGFIGAKVVGRQLGWTVALVLALSPPLIVRSAEVKPYSGDVALTLLLTWLALRDFERNTPRPSRALVTACLLAPWFSFPSIFVVAAIGVAWFTRALSSGEKVDRRRILYMVAGWAVVCLAAVAAVAASRGQLDAAGRERMHRDWGEGFPAQPFHVASAARWLFRTLADVAREVAGGRGGRPLAALGIAGVFVLWRRARWAAGVVVLPLLFAIAAAVVRQYPLSGRIALWVGPLLLLLAVAGAAGAARVALPSCWPRLAALAPSLVVVAPLLSAIQKPPVVQRWEEIKPVFRHIAANARAGDAVYIYSSAWQAGTFYRPLLERPSVEIVEGTCSASDRLNPLIDIDALRDHPRIWVVFSHLSPELRDHELIMGYLDAIGTRTDLFSIPPDFPGNEGTSATVLYELDPQRMAQLANASQWTIPDSVQRAPRRGCWPTFIPRRLVKTRR